MMKIAWRNMWRQGRRSLITAIGMSIGVAMIMWMIGLSDGMYVKMFDAMVRTQVGHVQIHEPTYPTQRSIHATLDQEQTLAALSDLKHGAGVSGRVHGFTLMASGDKAAGAQITGIDPAAEQRVTLLQDKMSEGRYLADDPAHEAMIGKGLAETLGVAVGSELIAVTQAADGSMGNDLYTVVGIFHTGSAILDRTGVFLHLADAQELLVLEGRLHEVSLLAITRDRIPQLKAELQAKMSGDTHLVRAWSEVEPMAAQMINLQDVGLWIMLIIVYGVSALGILNTMLMSVFERVKEFGVLRALGLAPRQLMAVVLWETIFLSLLAASIGGAMGGLLDWWMVVEGLDLSRWADGFSFAGVAFDPVMRSVIRADRIVIIILALIVMTVLASIWPAVRAARLNPVEAMRAD